MMKCKFRFGLSVLLSLLGISAASAQTYPGFPLQITPPPNTFSQGLVENAFPAGNQTGSFNVNTITVTSTAALTGASSFLQGTESDCSLQSTTVQGGVNCLLVFAGLNSPTSPSNVNRNYVAITGVGQANSGDGGTDTGAGAKGAIFGSNFVANAVPGAANLFEISGGEVDCTLQYGASTKLKMCWSIVSGPLDNAHGTTVDAALTIGAQAGSSLFNQGILFTIQNSLFPITTAGTMIGAETGSTTNGIDFSSVTFSGCSFKSTGFCINSVGNPTFGTTGASSGSILLLGSTGGSVGLTASATANFVQISQPVVVGLLGSTQGTLTLLGSTSGSTILSGSATGGHLGYAGSGSAPTNSACTGFTLATGSTDIAGKVTFTSATSCAFSFGTTYTNAPFCVVTPGTAATPSTVDVTTTTGILTANFTTAQTSMSWVCFGV